MTDAIINPRNEIVENIRVGANHIWVDVNEYGPNKTPLFGKAGSNRAPGYPAYFLAPFGGKYAGYTQGSQQNFNVKYDETAKNGSLSPTDATVAGEDFDVTGTLIMNKSVTLLKLLFPPGPRSGSGISGGGAFQVNFHNLVVLWEDRLNDIYDQDYIVGFFYRKGLFSGITIESGRDFAGIKFQYKSFSAGCDFNAGNRNYKVYFLSPETGATVTPGIDPNLPILQSPSKNHLLSDFYRFGHHYYI